MRIVQSVDVKQVTVNHGRIMMNNKFQGKRAELCVYDDATGFTPEERETYHSMLVNHSFDSGLNMLDDRFWIEGDDAVEMAVPSHQLNNYCFPANIVVGGYIEGTHEINFEPSKESLQSIIDNIIKGLDKANG
jgi:hypothetical protein